jgi:murein DD-endopeptidase MepM/ murein hydrolase activator NlpD
VRLRSLALGLVSACAFVAPAGAAAYPWPVRPFNKPHPVRANFGDPRTVFQLSLFTNGLEGPGDFQFHNGVDIAAKDGTPVYAVVSGTAKLIEGGTELSVKTDDDRTFQYFHIVPVVVDGQQVVAKRTLLGYVRRGFGHVHLSEIRGFRVWNPLAKGGLAPYRDTTKPAVTAIFMRAEGSLAPLAPLGVCGTVSIVAEAYDHPAMRVPGPFAGFPVSPALVTWSLRKVGGSIVQPEIPAFDVRTGLPTKPEFWDIYARGTYQNAPRFANRQFNLMPGRFLYNLNSAFDTRTVPNGVYQISASAEDTRGNRGFLNQRFTIVNQPRTETGCPPTAAKA